MASNRSSNRIGFSTQATAPSCSAAARALCLPEMHTTGICAMWMSARCRSRKPKPSRTGHHQIEQDDARCLLMRDVQRLRAILRRDDVKPLGIECIVQEFTTVAIVIDHEHAWSCAKAPRHVDLGEGSQRGLRRN
jgi:hypothetical protein